MYLQKINLLNFRNYEEAELEFSETVNCFTGNNGAGKTNLLDAIHYLSLCKSYFNPVDSQQIRYGTAGFMIQGIFRKNGTKDTVFCGVRRNQKKQFKRNKKDYQRLADHIGLYPLVMISPNDISLVSSGSEERRKFIDNVLSQTDSGYLDTLIQYNKNLAERNALLKRLAEGGGFDRDLLEVYDEQLLRYGRNIHEKRRHFLQEFTSSFNQHYAFITLDAEQVEISYESQLNETDFQAGLKASRERDRILQRTTFGIHKDELVFSIHDHPLKKFGSQGQQKSFLIALKLAKYNYLSKSKGFKPLILLDDIFDKLDHKRITRLMEMVVQENFGQIFITDTDAGRVQRIFNDIGIPVRMFEVTKGEVKQK